MKKIYALLFLLLSLTGARVNATTQEGEHVPFLEEGKVWKFLYHNPNGNAYDVSLTVKGDTVIGENTYKKIVDMATGSCDFVMREDESRVYCKYPKRNEYIVYDFGLNVGDSFVSQNANATVFAVDTIVVNGHAFRALDVRNEDDNMRPNWWVEGIGCMNYLTSSFPLPGGYFTFLQCQLDEEILFSQTEFRTLGVPSVTIENHESSASTIFDLQGRRLTGQPTKGVYIQDGRKVLVK